MGFFVPGWAEHASFAGHAPQGAVKWGELLAEEFSQQGLAGLLNARAPSIAHKKFMFGEM